MSTPQERANDVTRFSIDFALKQQMSEIRLEMTCGACPEQYDAFVGDELVGYLRLRHGFFTVEVPDCGGERVYEAATRGDGAFDVRERDYHLERAKAAIFAARIREATA